MDDSTTSAIQAIIFTLILIFGVVLIVFGIIEKRRYVSPDKYLPNHLKRFNQEKHVFSESKKQKDDDLMNGDIKEKTNNDKNNGKIKEIYNTKTNKIPLSLLPYGSSFYISEPTNTGIDLSNPIPPKITSNHRVQPQENDQILNISNQAKALHQKKLAMMEAERKAKEQERKEQEEKKKDETKEEAKPEAAPKPISLLGRTQSIAANVNKSVPPKLNLGLKK